MISRTDAFDAFVRPASAYPQIWRIILGFSTGIGVYILLAGAIAFVLVGYFELGSIEEVIVQIEAAASPEAMITLLATFFAMGVGAVFAAFWHWRGLLSLIGPLGRALRHFVMSLVISATIFAVIGAITSWALGLTPIEHLPLSIWLGYLPWALPLLLVQVGAEELVFRGYVLQQLAARFKSPLIWFFLPSVLFGLGHYSAELEPILAIMMVIATGLFGIVATDLTRRTGTIGCATGFHFSNNFFALLLVAVPGQLSGLGLYHAPFDMTETGLVAVLLILDMVIILVVWAVLARRLS